MNRTKTLKLIYSAICLSLALVLPLFTGQIPEIGKALNPMHIAIFLCGFLCGPIYGLCIGFVSPLLRFLIFGMPAILPTGVAMAVELAVYGGLSGLMYKLLPKRNFYIYIIMAVSMVAGRFCSAIVRYFLAGLSGTEFSFFAYFSGLFITSFIGIIVQFILVPSIIMVLKRAKLTE